MPYEIVPVMDTLKYAVGYEPKNPYIPASAMEIYKRPFESAVKDFIERSGQDYDFKAFKWSIMALPLYFVIDESTRELVGFFTLSFSPVNPKTGRVENVTIVHGWSNPNAPHAVKHALTYIDEQAREWGVRKISISTKRNSEAFERYFQKFGYIQSDVIFEKDLTVPENLKPDSVDETTLVEAV